MSKLKDTEKDKDKENEKEKESSPSRLRETAAIVRWNVKLLGGEVSVVELANRWNVRLPVS